MAIYALGPVKAHVKAAAYYYGPKYGIKTIYGYGPGSVAGSDHPKGLALDFMINNIANGHSVGQQLANDLVSNRGAYNVKYVIWNHQINNGGGWEHYSGVNPHTDHVHCSFNATAGTGGSTATIVPVGDSNVPVIGGLIDAFKSVNHAFEWLDDAHNWQRIGYFMAGALLIGFALIRLGGGKPISKVTGAVAGTVSKGVTRSAKP